MPNHFETLWEKCELLHKGSNIGTSASIDEFMLLLNLYKAIDQKTEMQEKERKKKIKSRIIGEILFTLTRLSLQDNINVFESLNDVLQDHDY